MKVSLQYDIPEEKSAMHAALEGEEWRDLAKYVADFCREKLTYNSLSEEARSIYEELIATLVKEMAKQKLDFS